MKLRRILLATLFASVFGCRTECEAQLQRARDHAGARADVEVEAPAYQRPSDAEPSVESSDTTGDEHGYVLAAGSATRKSTQIGALDEATCIARLKKAKVPFAKAPGAAKIDYPIVLTGPIGGIHFDTGRPYANRSASSGDAIDCRLGVSLIELAKVVKKHGITTVLVKSFHRPTQPILDASAPLRHRIGFAIDIAGFRTKKGVEWNVQRDFHGKIGQATCGPNAAKPDPDSPTARELWAVFCQIGATEAFDSGISPNYNASHFDHVHFDLTHDHPILFFP